MVNAVWKRSVDEHPGKEVVSFILYPLGSLPELINYQVATLSQPADRDQVLLAEYW